MFTLNVEELPRVNVILSDARYMQLVQEIEELEKDRIFCRHGFEHFLNVARIACILNQEYGYGLERELIYAAAILHDIGRVEEYQKGLNHETVSAKKSRAFLEKAGFDAKETDDICLAIANHRDLSEAIKRPLDEIIYKADKLSRNCFFCNVNALCNKADDKRNKRLVI